MKRNLSGDAAFGTPLPFADRDAGGADDLQCAGDTLRIGRFQSGGSFRIGFRKRCVGLLDRQGTNLHPDGGIDFGNRRDAVKQGTDVEAGAADQDREAPDRVGFADCLLCHHGPVRRRAGYSTIDGTEQAVGSAGFVLGRGAG